MYTRVSKQIKIIFALIRIYGIRKMLSTAYHAISNDSPFVFTDCPECGTEHRVHKASATRRVIKCTNCKAMFIVTKATVAETAFMRAFGGGS